MVFGIFRVVLNNLSRSVAKILLFLALSMSTPAVNAMRTLEEREAVVIVMTGNSYRRRDRSLYRRFGYLSEFQFVSDGL